jgi:hypothetical protein
VNVWVGDSLPVELTAPININADPPRPCSDVVREVLVGVAAGDFEDVTEPRGREACGIRRPLRRFQGDGLAPSAVATALGVRGVCSLLRRPSAPRPTEVGGRLRSAGASSLLVV